MKAQKPMTGEGMFLNRLSTPNSAIMPRKMMLPQAAVAKTA